MRNFILVLFILSLLSCNNYIDNKSLSSIDSLSMLINKDPLNTSFLNQRSQLYLENNKIDSAKIDIDKAYSLFKNDPLILLNRGDIYFELNRTRISRESWDRCLKLDPNNLDCRKKLTNLLCVVQDRGCESMIDTLVLLNKGLLPVSTIVHLKELKKYNKAIDLLNNILLEDHTNKEALSLLSIIYSDTSRFNQFFDSQLAEHYFNKIIDIYPNNFQVYYNFSKHKQNTSQYNEALKYYTMGVQLDTLHKQSYYNMGFCSMQLGEYDDGIEYFSKVINIDSSFLLAYHARAYLYEKTNNPDQAQSDWKNCLMLNPSYIPAIEGLSN